MDTHPIKRLLDAGWKPAELANELGFSVSTIYRQIKRTRFAPMVHHICANLANTKQPPCTPRDTRGRKSKQTVCHTQP